MSDNAPTRVIVLPSGQCCAVLSPSRYVKGCAKHQFEQADANRWLNIWVSGYVQSLVGHLDSEMNSRDLKTQSLSLLQRDSLVLINISPPPLSHRFLAGLFFFLGAPSPASPPFQRSSSSSPLDAPTGTFSCSSRLPFIHLFPLQLLRTADFPRTSPPRSLPFNQTHRRHHHHSPTPR